MNFHIIYYPLYMLIMQVFHDSDRNAWLRLYARLRSYARLWSEDRTPVICSTSVERHDSHYMRDSGLMSHYGRKTRLRSYVRLRSEDATPVVCPTLVGRYHSGHILDSGQKIWLRSYILTPVDVTTPVVYPDSGCRSCCMTPVIYPNSDHRSCRMSYLLICERLCMIELDDYNILQLKHLVKSILSKSTWLVHRSKPQHLTASHVQVSGHVPHDQW
jgi:hypothetical protein